MQDYPVRPGHAKKTDLASVFADCFGPGNPDGEWIAGSFGALKMVKARYDGLKKLVVDTEQDKQADVADGQKTIRAWNTFLETATGYNAKQRGKKAQEALKKAA